MATNALPSPAEVNQRTTANARALAQAVTQPAPGPWTDFAPQQQEAERGPWEDYGQSGEQPATDHGPVRNFLEGVGSGALSTVFHGGDLIRRMVGKERVIDKPEVQSLIKAPEGFAGGAGKFLEQAGEFALPSGWVGKATSSLPLLLKMAAQGATAGGVAALQSGGEPVPTALATTTGAAGPALGAALSATRFPAKLYQSALKPTWSMAKKEGDALVQTGLREGIPVSDKGVEKVGSMIDDIRAQISKGLQAHAAAGKTVDSKEVLKALDGLEDFYKNTAAPKDALDTLASIRQEFESYHGQKIPLDKAQQIKINTYQELKKSYGEMKGARVEGLKAVARGLKEQISQVFPEIANLNERQSKLLGLDDALTRAVWRIENHQVMGIGSPIAATAGKAVLGSPGAAVALLSKIVLDNPGVKSKLAISLARSGVKGANSIVNARMAALKGALQKAASGAVEGGSRQPLINMAAAPQPEGPKVANLAHVRAYAQQAGVSEADAVRRFQQQGYQIR